MALPENVMGSMAELARLADEMWFLAEDRSVDFSWYTKRATLSAVYASTGCPSMSNCDILTLGRGVYDDGQV